MPHFTIVIPTYNRAEKIKHTIQSVLNQTYSDFELLVMDDGSTDHTETIVNGFSDHRIRYEWAPNSGGPATPRNRGIAASKSPWISFLDADDIWYSRRLECVNDAIKNHPDIDVFCHHEMLNNIVSGKKSLLKYGPYQVDFYRTMLMRGNYLSTSAVTIRSDFLFRHSLCFNEEPDHVVVEDYDLWLRLANHGATFFFISTPLGEYVIESDNLTHATEKHRHNHRVVLKNHVYNIQKFEEDKDKLWKEISLQMDINNAFTHFINECQWSDFREIIRFIIFSPWFTLKYIFSKSLFKFSRNNFL